MQQPEHFRRVEKLEYIDADLGRPHLKHDVPKDRQTADEQNRCWGVLSGGEEPLFSFSRLPDQADTWQQRRNVTGASAGIGRATALGLASMGAHLARLVFETGDSVFTIDAPVVHNAVHHTSPHNPAGEKRCRRWCRGAG